MADDDKDFSFGTIDDDLSSDDGWGSLEDESGNTGDSFAPDGTENWGDDSVVEPGPQTNPPIPEAEETPEPGTKRSSSRMILYGLLVIVLSAAGFYYFTTSPLPPAAEKRPALASQTLAMPERPEPVAVPESAASVPAAVDSTKPMPKGTLLEVMPTEAAPASAVAAAPVPAPPPATATPAPVVAAPVKSTAPPAKVAAAKPKSKATVPVNKLQGGEKPAAGTYSIQVGAFADVLHRDEALAKIRKLGFDPQVEPIKKMMPMTRLLVGVYAAEEGRKKARDLAATIPSAFPLHQGKQIAVYAGSFSTAEEAQVFIGELQQKGIQVSIQKAEVELTLSRVTFGSFSDQATAAAAGARAQGLGLETHVFRNH